eukprot:987470-Prymnesium_polylepis.1
MSRFEQIFRVEDKKRIVVKQVGASRARSRTQFKESPYSEGEAGRALTEVKERPFFGRVRDEMCTWNRIEFCRELLSATALACALHSRMGYSPCRRRAEKPLVAVVAPRRGRAEPCGTGPKGPPQGFGGNQSPPAHSRMALRHT